MNRMILTAVVACFFVTGCGLLKKEASSGYGVPSLATADLDRQSLIIKRLTGQDDAGNKLIDMACFHTPSADQKPDAATCTAQRNQALAALMLASDEICMAHRRSIYGNDAAFNITLGSLTSLFAGASTIATGESAKTIYSALALFFNSERSLVNEVVYKQMLASAIDQKISETMDTKRDTLNRSLKKDITDYSAHQAITDMVDLHNSCSFMEGLRKALAEGTDSHKGQKISLLRQALADIQLEMRSTCTVEDASQSKADQTICTALQGRHTAVSDALKEAEIGLSAAN